MAGVAGLAVVAVGGVVACDPGGLSSATVAFTTDQTVTAELERQKADVQWLNCTGSYDDGNGNGNGKSAAPTASENTVVKVDCEGETKDGKDITVTGRITRAVSGACVRGDLVAKIDGKEWFHVNGLGNCDATPSPVNPPGNGGQQPGPTVTVTVTKTVYCQERPNCWPEGK
ncbi:MULTISPECIES: hypothetical protein [unclassified Streptomyces]|uniref:hypothetical protein n=1 Tax=Streptomyces sp. T21Q-yed TaxID=3018441 RepID=UPI002366C132|nr:MULTISPECIES: hypothetical protein [unclassified Streptomyces]MDF3149714.1 hypothetical protein [Streptomyces sp. T21Q-yed]WDF44625.1 hypothetical protein PBV52_14945 [Streptomyces sp. T12]